MKLNINSLFISIALCSMFAAHAGPCGSKIIPASPTQELHSHSPIITGPLSYAELPKKQIIPSQDTQHDLCIENKNTQLSSADVSTIAAQPNQHNHTLEPLIIPTVKFKEYGYKSEYPSQVERDILYKLTSILLFDWEIEQNRRSQIQPQYPATLNLQPSGHTRVSLEAKALALKSTHKISLWERRHQSKEVLTS